MPRKQCACGCGEWFESRDRTKFKSWDHYQRSGHLHAQRTAASHKAKAARDAQRANMTLAGFGRLTEREMRIYERGRHNGKASGYDMGRRKGYADACGEGAEVTWRKGRAA